MNIVICGSRDFADYDQFKFELDAFFINMLHADPNFGDEICIISGGARGADKMAERYCKEKGWLENFKEYLADWDTHGKKAGILRNLQMLEVADVVFAFWDGKSKGTKHMIDECEKRNIYLMLITI